MQTHSGSGGGLSGVTGNLTPALSQTVYNVAAAVAGTEYSQVLSNNVKKFAIKCRGNAQIQLAFVSGQTGSNFITIPSGAVLSEDSLLLTGKTLYFQTNKPTQIVEILEWF